MITISEQSGITISEPQMQIRALKLPKKYANSSNRKCPTSLLLSSHPNSFHDRFNVFKLLVGWPTLKKRLIKEV